MTKISISQRAKNTPSSAVRKLVPLANEAKKRGVKVYHVNIGQPDIPTPPEIVKYFHTLKREVLEYAPSQGMPETVNAWHEFYAKKGFEFETTDLLITAGGAEGLTFAFFAVADPGTELLVIEPFYTSYAISASMGNIKLTPITTIPEDGFHLPKMEEIEKKISSKTKGIVVCNPNNPTGTVYTDDEVKMLVKIAVEHNLFIISDETYQEIVFGGKKVLPFASFKEIENHLIIVDSVSKRFNACGARVGCIASKNKEIMSSIMRFAQGRLSVATVEQLAVCKLLKNHEKYVEKVRKIYEKRRDVVMTELRKIEGVDFIPSEGAFYLMPQIPVKDSEDFAKFLLNEFEDRGETVMVSPAGGFYASKNLGRKEIRIAYVLEERKMCRAIELLNVALKKYNKRS